MDLNTLSLKELKKLRKDVDKTIADFEDRKKREARAELEKKAAEFPNIAILQIASKRGAAVAEHRFGLKQLKMRADHAKMRLSRTALLFRKHKATGNALE